MLWQKRLFAWNRSLQISLTISGTPVKQKWGDSSVSRQYLNEQRIAINGLRYGLNGPGFESRLGEREGDFSLKRPDLRRGPPSVLYNG